MKNNKFNKVMEKFIVYYQIMKINIYIRKMLFQFAVFANVFVLLSAAVYAGDSKSQETDLENNRKSYYVYFMSSYVQEADAIKKIWAEKYSKTVMHRKFSEIPIKILYSQGKKPDCVPTCIAIICEYYNVKHEPQWMIGRRIRSRYGGKTIGTSVYNTVKELKDVGLKVCAYEGSIDDIKEKTEGGTPVLVLQRYSKKIPDGHARIVIGYNDMRAEFTVIDPSFGNKKCYFKYKDFMELWESTAYCAILAFK